MLKDIHFSYLLFGRFVSNASGSIVTMVLAWLILENTENSLWLGFFYATLFLPDIFSFLVGGLIDRYSKKKLLIGLELGSALFTLLVAAALINRQEGLTISMFVIICVLAFGVNFFATNTFSVQHAYVQQSIVKQDLEKASRNLSTMYKISNYTFGLLTGFLMLHIHNIGLIFVGAMCYIISSILFLKLKEMDVSTNTVEEKQGTTIGRKKSNVWLGFRYIFASSSLTAITLTGGVINFFFAGLPIYLLRIAGEQGSPLVLGLLNSGMMLGGFIGTALVSGTIFKNFAVGHKHIVNYVLFGLGLIITGWVAQDWLIIIGLAVSGVFWGVTHVTHNPIKQTLAPAQHLGKISTAENTLAVGTMPLGALFFGQLGEGIPIQVFFLLFGLVYLMSALLYIKITEIRTFSLE